MIESFYHKMTLCMDHWTNTVRQSSSVVIILYSYLLSRTFSICIYVYIKCPCTVVLFMTVSL